MSNDNRRMLRLFPQHLRTTTVTPSRHVVVAAVASSKLPHLLAQFTSEMSTVSPPPPAKKMVYFPKLEATASHSSEFRRVLWTGEHSQLVIMTVPVEGDIGQEIHTVDQHLVFISGTAKAIVGGEEKSVKPGDLVIVPAGTKHNFVNTGSTPLVLYTVYAPAEHAVDSVHKTKEEGDRLEEEGKDEPPAWAKK